MLKSKYIMSLGVDTYAFTSMLLKLMVSEWSNFPQISET